MKPKSTPHWRSFVWPCEGTWTEVREKPARRLNNFYLLNLSGDRYEQ